MSLFSQPFILHFRHFKYINVVTIYYNSADQDYSNVGKYFNKINMEKI